MVAKMPLKNFSLSCEHFWIRVSDWNSHQKGVPFLFPNRFQCVRAAKPIFRELLLPLVQLSSAIACRDGMSLDYDLWDTQIIKFFVLLSWHLPRFHRFILSIFFMQALTASRLLLSRCFSSVRRRSSPSIARDSALMASRYGLISLRIGEYFRSAQWLEYTWFSLEIPSICESMILKFEEIISRHSWAESWSSHTQLFSIRPRCLVGNFGK